MGTFWSVVSLVPFWYLPIYISQPDPLSYPWPNQASATASKGLRDLKRSSMLGWSQRVISCKLSNSISISIIFTEYKYIYIHMSWTKKTRINLFALHLKPLFPCWPLLVRNTSPNYKFIISILPIPCRPLHQRWKCWSCFRCYCFAVELEHHHHHLRCSQQQHQQQQQQRHQLQAAAAAAGVAAPPPEPPPVTPSTRPASSTQAPAQLTTSTSKR